jgi:hypothetical protein
MRTHDSQQKTSMRPLFPFEFLLSAFPISAFQLFIVFPCPLPASRFGGSCRITVSYFTSTEISVTPGWTGFFDWNTRVSNQLQQK